jgi:hypothetical protein
MVVTRTIPAEAGRLFIETQSIAEGTRDIVELGCDGAQ